MESLRTLRRVKRQNLSSDTANYIYYFSENYQPIDKIVAGAGKQLSLTADEVKHDLSVLKASAPDSPVAIGQ